jgi:hypothetical protein
MPMTLTEVEVKKTIAPTTPLIPPTPKVIPAPARHTPAEQPQNNGALFWVIASISLLVAGCSAFLVVRRWLGRNSQDNDELQA